MKVSVLIVAFMRLSVPLQVAFDWCTLYERLRTDIFLPAIWIGILAGLVYFALGKAVSAFFPQFEGTTRRIPTNIVVAILTLAIGPYLLTTLASVAGLTPQCVT